jgi:RNase H-fold protein (predicted Holliday junction resolvase)
VVVVLCVDVGTGNCGVGAANREAVLSLTRRALKQPTRDKIHWRIADNPASWAYLKTLDGIRVFRALSVPVW